MKPNDGKRHGSPGRGDGRRQFRSPSPRGPSRYEKKKSVNFKYPSAQTAESNETSGSSHEQQDDAHDIDPDLRANSSNANDVDDDIERALQAWNAEQVMGTANRVMAQHRETIEITASEEELASWRRPSLQRVDVR